MNKKSTFMRKALSVFMAVIMIVGIALCAPISLFAPKTEAASAGNYFIRITWKVEEDGTFKKDYDGYVTSSDDDEDHQDDSAGMSIAYIPENGTASSTQYLDIDIKSELGSTGDKTFTKEVAGFPTMVYMYMNNDSALAWADTIAVVSKIEIGASASGTFVTVWTGKMQIDSISKEYGISVGTNGDKTYLNSDSDTFIENSSYNWSMPTPTTIALTSSSQIDVAIPPTGETVSTNNILATAYDKYGVTWKDPATWVLTTTNTPTISSENLTGYGISLRNALASGNCIVDITSGAENYQLFYGNYVYINAYCVNAKSVCVPIKLSSESFVVNFYNLAGDTILKTERVAKGGHATAPDDSAFASELSTPNNTYHYTIGEWDKDFSNVTSDLDVYPTQNAIRHDYTYDFKTITAATCKTTGTMRKYCVCGKYTDETLAKTNVHTPSAATCGEVQTCTVCGKVLQQLPAHSYTKQIMDTEYLASEATCTEPMYFYYACTYCDAKGTTTYAYGDAKGHSYTAQNPEAKYLASAATCSAPATYYYACSGCGAVGTSTYTYGSTAAHSYGKASYTWDNNFNCTATRICTANSSHVLTETVKGVYSVVTPAGCETKGVGKYTATFADTENFTAQTDNVAIPATGHDFTGSIKSNNDGTHSYACVNGCGEYGNTENCTYGDYTETTAPGCTTKGEKQRICSVCNYVDTAEIDAAGHNFGEATYTWNGNSCTAERVCLTDSTHKVTETVEGVYSVVTAATCVSKGVGRYTATFTDTENFTAQTTDVEIEMLEHDYSGSAKSNNDGTHSLMCVNGCKEYGAPVSCTYGEYSETIAPGCTAKGEKARTCSACGYIDTAEVEAKGHSYGEAVYTWDDDFNCTATKTCINDSTHKITETVKGAYSVVTTAGCEEAGEGKYTATFTDTENFTAQSETVSIPATSHNFTGAVKSNNNGTHSYACINGCGKYGNTENCTYGDYTETIAPGCTTKGEKQRICSECSYVDKEEIKAAGHNFGAPVYTWDENNNCTATVTCLTNSEHVVTETVKGVYSVVKAADCLNAGEGKYTATFKNTEYFTTQTEKVTINALGHDYIHHDAKNAGCTEKGWKAYDTCSRCDYSTYVEIAPTGHTPGKAATCTKAQTCVNCGTVLNGALGHNYVLSSVNPATCISEGAQIYACTRCSASYSKSIAKVDHIDDNGDGICDVCKYDIQADREANCSHLCHKTGFMGFLWKIVNLFNKLFKINQYCECGAKHW